MRGRAATERARQAIGRLPGGGAPWPAVAGEVIAQLRRVVGFDSFCASQNDPRTAIPAAALADNDAVGGRQRVFWQIEYRKRQAPWFTSGDAAAVAGLAGPIAALARASWTAGWRGPDPGEDPPGTVLVTDEGRQVTATAATGRWLAGWIRCSGTAAR